MTSKEIIDKLISKNCLNDREKQHAHNNCSFFSVSDINYVWQESRKQALQEALQAGGDGKDAFLSLKNKISTMNSDISFGHISGWVDKNEAISKLLKDTK